jgi:hypothetical protein
VKVLSRICRASAFTFLISKYTQDRHFPEESVTTNQYEHNEGPLETYRYTRYGALDMGYGVRPHLPVMGPHSLRFDKYFEFGIVTVWGNEEPRSKLRGMDHRLPIKFDVFTTILTKTCFDIS